jgi:hypothetical protein
MVDGGYKRSSKTGKYYMRGIGAWTDVADVGVLADHTRYWLTAASQGATRATTTSDGGATCCKDRALSTYLGN